LFPSLAFKSYLCAQEVAVKKDGRERSGGSGQVFMDRLLQKLVPPLAAPAMATGAKVLRVNGESVFYKSGVSQH
jgi:hypothetical protein